MIKQKLTQNKFYSASVLYKTFATHPLGFIDVGARGGSHSLVEPLHDQVSFLGFEPDLTECAALNANIELGRHWRNFEVLPYALSDTTGRQTLHIVSAATNTSLLVPDPMYVDRYNMAEKWSVVDKIELDVVPLDSIIFNPSEAFSCVGEIMKIDTQGTEFEILNGAKRLLTSNTMCVVVEVEFFPIYKEQKLFSDVELLLREMGFAFYGFLTMHTRSKKLLNKQSSLGKERLFYADAVFFKDPFIQRKDVTQRQLHVLIMSAILTGYYDFALELMGSPLLGFNTEQTQCLNDLVQSISFKSPMHTKHEVVTLLETMESDQNRINLHLGKFIDKLNFPNFEDIALD